MKPKTKSLLESLVELVPTRDNALMIESRGANIIASAVSLMESITEQYGAEIAEELEKRLLSSIRNKNNGKFVRATRTLVIETSNHRSTNENTN